MTAFKDASWVLSDVAAKVTGTGVVRVQFAVATGLVFQRVWEKYPQSIIGATLNRREGSGRVVCGVKAVSKGILVYAFLYHLPGF